MAIVKLHRGDFRKIKPVASKLFLHWEDKKNTNFWATLTGICAEYAVIAYINEFLRVKEKITFREEYDNGKDGGFDFCFPKDMTWDVKSCGANEKFESKYVLKTKAQIICFVKKLSQTSYLILGYVPRSKLLSGDINNIKLIQIDTLLNLFPDKFDKFPSNEGFKERKYKSQLEKTGNLINGVILDVATKHTINTKNVLGGLVK